MRGSYRNYLVSRITPVLRIAIVGYGKMGRMVERLAHDFIEPTGICESQSSYICLNTYDRARFTFGFLQYAALVPDGDFVTWMRGILQRPEMVEWFPDLKVQNGRIAKETLQGPVQLEDSQSTGKLMDFLNRMPDCQERCNYGAGACAKN